MNRNLRLIIAGVITAGTIPMLSACTSDASTDNAGPSVSATAAAASSAVLSAASSATSPATQSNSVLVAAERKSRPEVVVYKSATCGCCKDWVSYLEDEGFTVESINHDNVDEIKTLHGLTDPGLKSCHTALIDGYVIEGHVPVNDIDRLLAERPDIVGLTAPGMPLMSPGMGSTTPRDYDVLAFRKDGSARVYSSY